MKISQLSEGDILVTPEGTRITVIKMGMGGRLGITPTVTLKGPSGEWDEPEDSFEEIRYRKRISKK